MWQSWFTCVTGLHAASHLPDAVPPEGGWVRGTGAVCFRHFCFVALAMDNMWLQEVCILCVGECLGSMLGLKTEEMKPRLTAYLSNNWPVVWIWWCIESIGLFFDFVKHESTCMCYHVCGPVCLFVYKCIYIRVSCCVYKYIYIHIYFAPNVPKVSGLAKSNHKTSFISFPLFRSQRTPHPCS